VATGAARVAAAVATGAARVAAAVALAELEGWAEVEAVAE
jgi:hypothetical protein